MEKILYEKDIARHNSKAYKDACKLFDAKCGEPGCDFDFYDTMVKNNRIIGIEWCMLGRSLGYDAMVDVFYGYIELFPNDRIKNETYIAEDGTEKKSWLSFEYTNNESEVNE